MGSRKIIEKYYDTYGIKKEVKEMTKISREIIEEYYDTYGKDYDLERTGPYYSFINNLEASLVKEYSKGKNVLEIGCGTGIILDNIKDSAKNAMGIDLSLGMLNEARKKGLNVKKADVTKLPFEKNSFDLVYSFKVLPHVPDMNKAINEITRVVKKQGILILELYNPYSLKAINDFINRKKIYIRHDSLKEIKSYFGDSGWKIIRIRGIKIFTPHHVVYRIPFISGIFRFIEGLACDSIFKYLGGYFIVVLKYEK